MPLSLRTLKVFGNATKEDARPSRSTVAACVTGSLRSMVKITPGVKGKRKRGRSTAKSKRKGGSSEEDDDDDQNSEESEDSPASHAPQTRNQVPKTPAEVQTRKSVDGTNRKRI